MDLTVESGDTIEVYYELTNSGPTPAVNIRARSRLLFDRQPAAAIHDQSFYGEVSHGSMLFPDSNIDDTARLEGESIEARAQSGEALYFYALVEYQDIFSAPHETTLCLWFDAQKRQFVFCGTHNSMR